MVKIEIRPIYDTEGKKISATEKTLKIFGVTIMKKTIIHPSLKEYEWHPFI